MSAAVARAETVSAIDISSQAGQTHVSITRAAPGLAPHIFALGGEKPRVVIDWPQAEWGVGQSHISQSGNGVVKHVRYARNGQAGLRVVFDLVSGAKLASHNVGATHISLSMTAQDMPRQPQQAHPRKFSGAVPYPRLSPQKHGVKPAALPRQHVVAARKRPVVVIDPGHGGRDPGAIGKAGTHEKSITMKAASELKRQLDQTGRYDVVLTRSGDKYIAHEERLRIARAGGADLFISVHADSTKSSKARGASVYTLADRAKKRTKEVINTQNWIMDVDLTTQSDPVGDILVDLAQRKTNSQSELFADILVNKLSRSTKLIGNSHRRAGYFVLLAPDVPAVLLELGFLSNAHDEKLLKSANHRRKVMGSVVTAINTYFDTQKS